MAAGKASRLRLLPMPSDGEASAEEYVALEAEDNDGTLKVENDDDGGATYYPPGGKEDDKPELEEGFYGNLATVIPEMVMQRISTDLLTKIDQDKEARKERDKQYEEGIRRTGLGKDAPGGAEFEGASRVVHPSLVEACIDGESRLMKELWPPSGPCKAKILGEPTQEKTDRADRKVRWMNYQLTTLMKEARPTTEKTLMQVMLGGSQFIKLWYDHRLKRPRMQFVGVDKIYLPAQAEDYQSSFRRTFDDTVSAVEFAQRVTSGQYRDLGLAPPAAEPDKSESQKATDKIEGVEDVGMNIDGARTVYEVMSYLEITSDMAEVLDGEQEGQLYPYLISIDLASRRILSIYRDWEEDDETHEPIEHIFEFPMLYWRGPYSIGFAQIIGGLSGASTGALRALLDSAHIANMQGGLILKGSGTGGQSVKAQPGDFIEISGNSETPDIRKTVMQFNTKEPSNVLFQLLGGLVDTTKGIIRTSLDETPADTNANTPVGTQLSRVEEGLVVFSSIHGRTHYAFDRFIAGLHRLNRLYLDDSVTVDVDGKELMVMRQDFQGSPDVQPVSDPTVYSDQQRFAQLAAVQQSAALFPGLYKVREIAKRQLKLLKVPNPDELLSDEPKPTELNAVNENVAMVFGRPVQVFPDQDHLAHLQVHLDFGNSPVLGGNPIVSSKFLPGFIQHCSEHIVFFYLDTMNKLVSDAAGKRAAELFSQDESVKLAFDQLLAIASQRVVPDIAGTFAQAMPVLTAGMQKLQSMMQPPPMDPAAAAAKAASDETQRKTQADQNKAQTDQTANAIKAQALDVQRSKIQSDAQAKERQNQTAQDNNTENNTTKMNVAVLDTDTAKQIAANKIAHDQATHLQDGVSLSGGAP